MKTITLKARLPDSDGNPMWHDCHVINNALSAIARGKNMVKSAPWIEAASIIQDKADEVGLGKVEDYGTNEDGTPQQRLRMPEFTVELKNNVAHLLFGELIKLNFELFGALNRFTGQPHAPNMGSLNSMLREIAAELGEVIPEGEDDEEEKVE